MEHLNPFERALKSRLESYQPDVKADWNSFSQKLPKSGGLSSVAKMMIGAGAGVAAVVGGIAYSVMSEEESLNNNPVVEDVVMLDEAIVADPQDPAASKEESTTIVLFDKDSNKPDQNEEIAVVTSPETSQQLTQEASENIKPASEKENIKEAPKKALQFNVPQIFCVNVAETMSLDERAEQVVWDFGNGLEFGNKAQHTFNHVGKHRVELSYILDGKKESKYFDVFVQGAEKIATDNTYEKDLDHGVLTLKNQSNLDLTWYVNGQRINNQKETQFEVHEHGKYEIALKGTDVNGCPVVKSEPLNVNAIYKVLHPNSFTPNNDGNNDYFMPEFSNEVSAFVLIISDLQGNIVYETKALDHPWDGILKDGKTAAGMYAWSLTLKTPKGNLEKHNGKINVLR